MDAELFLLSMIHRKADNCSVLRISFGNDTRLFIAALFSSAAKIQLSVLLGRLSFFAYMIRNAYSYIIFKL